MTNKLTQAELIDIAKEAGFKETIWRDILGVKVESLAKFAQLIQQRQGEPVYQNLALLAPAKYGWVDVDESRFNNFPGVKRTLYTRPQLVAQALEKAVEVCSNAYLHRATDDWRDACDLCQNNILALIDQPVEPTSQESRQVEQGGDELVEALETIAAYQLTRDQEMGVAAMRKIAREALANRRGGE